ncbi:MAG: hypothetical protein CL927_04025 [Deltaproteobacteria bacterium]|nr:hypothetical protein [Deltaproteobacteria bacterium]HCH64758.1 hypothetical protein [Deltaproteobacteria bacterium]
MNPARTPDITTASTRGSKEAELFMLLIGVLSVGVMFGTFSVVSGTGILAGGVGMVLFSLTRDLPLAE